MECCWLKNPYSYTIYFVTPWFFLAAVERIFGVVKSVLEVFFFVWSSAVVDYDHEMRKIR